MLTRELTNEMPGHLDKVSKPFLRLMMQDLLLEVYDPNENSW